MKDSVTGATEHRPTVRLIAAKVGLSFSAVAKALRHDPRIPEATRKRIEQAAMEMGYRPDPEVAKLMRHLQTRRKPKFISTIYGLTSFTTGACPPYYAQLFESAKRRAETLGHGFQLMYFPAREETPAQLTRMLRARGVEGLLLLPISTSQDLSSKLDWSKFSVVAATHSVLRPEFHRVVPDHFGNMLDLCKRLAALGYRRIGLVLDAAHDLRVHHGYSAAVTWQNTFGGTEAVQPLVYQKNRDLKAWFERERPDAIIGAGCTHCEEIARELKLRVPGPVGFAAANNEASHSFAGIDERPREIGTTAINLLHAKILEGERGTPTIALRAMISGAWMTERSVTNKRTRRR